MRALLLTLSLLTGCSLAYSDDLSQKQCNVQADCDDDARRLGTPLVCRSNACQAFSCETTSECPRGTACVDNQCLAPRDAGTAAPLTCAQDGDCVNGSRCGFDHACYAIWSCLDQAADWPTSASSLHLRLPIRSMASLDDPAAVGGLSVVACDEGDVACASPRVTNASVAMNDTVLDLPFTNLPGAFHGFVRIDPTSTPADADAGVLSTWVHFPDVSPLAGDVYAQNRLLTVTAGGIRARAAAAGVSLDTDLGVVALQAYDCGGRPIDGAALRTADGTATSFLALQSESRLDATSGRTGSEGAGLLVNVPGGAQTLIIRDVTANRTLSDGVQLYVAPHAVNYVYYYPRYSAVKKWMDEAGRRGLPN